MDVHILCVYLWDCRLQNDVADGQRGSVEHGGHHNQYIRSVWWAVGGKVEQNSDAVFVISSYRAHFA